MTRAILVTGARAPVAIDLARAFAAAGHDVSLGDSVAAYAARAARVGRGHVLRLPPARHAFAAYADALQAWTQRHPDGVIVPTCEEVFYAAEAGSRRGFAAQVLAPLPETLRRLHSKIEFAAWARDIGITVPETRAITSAREASTLVTDAGNGLVLKREFSRFGTATLIRPTAHQLAGLQASTDCRWALQQFVQGEEICLWTAALNGEIVASVAYRPSWRLGRSASFAFEAIPCPAALEVARTLATAGRITGQLSFDIILRPDGEAVPIECNPRAVSGVHLFSGDAAVAHAMLGDGPPAHRTQGLAYLGPAMLLIGVPQALRDGQLRRWAGDMSRGHDVLLGAGGARVAAGALLDAGRFAWTGLSRKRSPTRQTTHDLEWNGEVIS